MSSPWKELLANTDCRGGATAQQIESLTQLFPEIGRDYLDFLQTCNGVEGSIGDSYIILWSASDLLELNEAYNVSEFVPGLLLIGTDGGNEGFGFDFRDAHAPIVQIPLIGMEWLEAKTVGRDFIEFLRYLGSGRER